MLDLVEKRQGMVEDLSTELAPLTGVRLERTSPLAVPLDLRAQLLDHPAIRRAASTAW